MSESTSSDLSLPTVLLPEGRARVFDLNVFECRNARSEEKRVVLAGRAGDADILTLQEDVAGCGALVFRAHRVVAFSGDGRLRNSILVHRSLEVTGPLGRQDLVISREEGEEERSAAAVVLQAASQRRVILATTHLIGGRYDDARAPELRQEREGQLRRLLDALRPDVIAGDFNSFPEHLYARYEARILAYGGKFGIADPGVWRSYMTSGHRFLERRGFVRMPYAAERTAETNARGNTIVDWVYYRPESVELRSPAIVQMYDESSAMPEDPDNPRMLSDHHAIAFSLALKDA